MIVIKLNDELKRKIQGQNVSLVAQTTVNKEKTLRKKNNKNNNRKLKILLNITPITDHYYRNGQTGDTNPQSSCDVKPGNE